MAHKYYAVRNGRTPGIYNSWPECQKQVKGFNKPRFKSFLTKAEAEAFLKGTDSPRPAAGNDAMLDAPLRKGAIVTYTDGGSRNHGNKKGGHVKENDKAAWAYLIVMPDGKKQSAADGELGATNNRMEIMALLNALTYLDEQGLSNEAIDIVADSKYVLDSITKHWLAGWKRRGWQTSGGQAVKNEALWKKVDQILPRFTNLRYHWTKGHADNAGNVFVDEKLNAAMNQMGHSGTIRVARAPKQTPVPKADENVKRAALSNIEGLLNRKPDAPDPRVQTQPTGDANDTVDHTLSTDESVDNLKRNLHQLDLFNDTDE